MPTLTVLQPTVFKRSTAQSTTLLPDAKVSVEVGRVLEVEYAYRVGVHAFVKLRQGLGSVGRVGYFYLPHVDVALDELRGVWLTNVDSQVLSSREAIEVGLHRLKALGFNTIYPAVWQRGYTLYPSPVMQRVGGVTVMPNSPFAERDMLAELIEVARSLELRVIPWFEYGLMLPPHTPIDQRCEHWITLTQTGSKHRIKQTNQQPDSNIWMNPCHPEVQQFLMALIADVIARYPVDGIQLDDHFAFPVELGYDPITQTQYRQECGRKAPLNHQDKAWKRWVYQKTNQLIAQIARSVKAQNPDCILSLSPNPLGFTREHLQVDWQAWVQAGHIDELVLQVYRDQLSAFNGELDKSEVRHTRDQIPVAIGILSGLRVRSVATDTLMEQIRSLRQRQFAGMAFFFYETVMNYSLSPQRVARSETELQNLLHQG